MNNRCDLSFVDLDAGSRRFWTVADTDDYVAACEVGEACGNEYIKYRLGLLDEGITLADIYIDMRGTNEGFYRGFALAVDRFIATR